MSAWIDRLPGFFRRAVEEKLAVRNQTASANASTTTGGGSINELVVVWKAAHLMEAQVVKGRLESEGIPALIRGEALAAIYGLTTGHLAAARVLVPAPLAEKALALLSAQEEEDASSETLDD
ncbi:MULTISPECIES: putative signal transducing protein [Caldilinea]|jgi:hypothetical protein|nr:MULTISPECIES: DUF2007 domain-containing protein [Caldilinea]MBO9392895.1 DUF2007 domain-containing protein [Caldilinea sp.]GIV74128.1 MAG: hypothetical protein KatS3mg049_2684 [Caldilinea sp.]